jgi:hypothetical protein
VYTTNHADCPERFPCAFSLGKPGRGFRGGSHSVSHRRGLELRKVSLNGYLRNWPGRVLVRLPSHSGTLPSIHWSRPGRLPPALGAGLLTPPSSDRRSPGNAASHRFATSACFSVDWVQGRVAGTQGRPAVGRTAGSGDSRRARGDLRSGGRRGQETRAEREWRSKPGLHFHSLDPRPSGGPAVQRRAGGTANEDWGCPERRAGPRRREATKKWANELSQTEVPGYVPRAAIEFVAGGVRGGWRRNEIPAVRHLRPAETFRQNRAGKGPS